jgi:glycosyltransferase involved in cell wall biosynthesis
MQKPKFVSVIIPVLNDIARLEICLRALENQTYAKDAYEVIVIDNGSLQSPDQLVQCFPQAKLAYEAQRGSYAARNHGLSIASGEILAFTDADCIPALDWLVTGVEILLVTPNCGLVAGRVNAFFQNPERPTAAELYDSITYLQQKDYVEKRQFGATANLFTTQAVMNTIGPFNASLQSGGDMEWGQRVASQGYTLIYADNCYVAHPARHSVSELSKKVTRIYTGHLEISRNQAEFSDKSQKQSLLNIHYLLIFKPPLITAFRKFFDGRLGGFSQRIQVFLVTFIVHYLIVFTRVKLLFYQSKKKYNQEFT